jgi:hypothetical protein
MNFRNLAQRLFLHLFFLLLHAIDFAQSKTVTGRVNDSRGAGLSGVTVSAKGQNASTATNETGQFTITVPTSTTVLVFSSIGFGSQEYTLGASNTATVTLSQRIEHYP